MLPDEGESRQVVVETYPGMPGFIVVALRTVLAECPLMNIVLPVAAIAGSIQLSIFGAFDMAGRAFQFSVTATQWELGFGVMVKRRQVPTSDLVTVTAFFTVRSLVNIIVAMAAVTAADTGIRF